MCKIFVSKYLLTLYVLLLLLAVVAKQTVAADMGGLGIYPAYPDDQNPVTQSWFVYNLVPGEEKKDAFIVKNTSNKTLSAKIYPADGTTTQDGSFTLLGQKDQKKGIGRWVKLSQESVLLSPGEQKIIEFSLRVPEDTKVGDHTGGIILENEDVQKGKGVNVVTRVGVRIYETVPGQLIRKLNIANITNRLVNDKVVFHLELENKGNVQLNPQAKFTISNSFGGGLNGGLNTFDASLGTILPSGSTKVPVTWQQTPLAGNLHIRAEISYGGQVNEKIERELSFFFVSNRAKLYGLLGFLAIFFLWVFSKVKKRK